MSEQAARELMNSAIREAVFAWEEHGGNITHILRKHIGEALTSVLGLAKEATDE